MPARPWLPAVLALAFWGVPASAQVTYGARLGALVTDAAFTQTDVGFDPLTAPAPSAFAEVPLGTRGPVAMSGGLDFGYGLAGWDIDVSSSNPDGTRRLAFRAERRMHYLSLAPALTGRLAGPGPSVAPYLSVGPRVDLKIAERDKFNGDWRSTDDYADLALGGSLGLGAAFPHLVGPGELRADVRLSYVATNENVRQRTAEVRLSLAL